MVVYVPDQRRESQLDLLHDLKRDTKSQSSLFAGHNHGTLSLERRDEALELELEWLARRRLELDAIHEGGDVRRRRPNRKRVDVGL